MCNALCVHAVNEAKIIHMFGHFGKQRRNRFTGLPVLLKIPERFHHHLLGGFSKVVETISQDIDFLLMTGKEFWFVIKGVHMTGTALHEEENDTFGPGGNMSGQRRQGIFNLIRTGMQPCLHT